MTNQALTQLSMSKKNTGFSLKSAMMTRLVRFGSRKGRKTVKDTSGKDFDKKKSGQERNKSLKIRLSLDSTDGRTNRCRGVVCSKTYQLSLTTFIRSSISLPERMVCTGVTNPGYRCSARHSLKSNSHERC